MQQQVRGFACQGEYVEIRVADDEFAKAVTHADHGLRRVVAVDRVAHNALGLAVFDNVFELGPVTGPERFESAPSFSWQVQAFVGVHLERLGLLPIATEVIRHHREQPILKRVITGGDDIHVFDVLLQAVETDFL